MKVAVCRPLTPCPPRKTASRQSPRTPQPPRVPHHAVRRRDPPGRPGESADRLRAIGQFRAEACPAVTSESRLPRVVPFPPRAARGPGAAARGGRDSMILSHLASPRDSTRRGHPGSCGAKTATLTWIWPCRSGSATTPAATSPGGPNTEHRTPNTEHRTPNTEHRTPNTEHRTPERPKTVPSHGRQPRNAAQLPGTGTWPGSYATHRPCRRVPAASIPGA
jgi:hypothetical protein